MAGGSAMKVSVPKESAAGERRVALVPEVVQRLAKQGGHDVVVESGAGEPTFPDAAVHRGGRAADGDGFSGEVVAKVAPPSAEEIGRLQRGQVLIAHPPAADERRGRAGARRRRA